MPDTRMFIKRKVSAMTSNRIGDNIVLKVLIDCIFNAALSSCSDNVGCKHHESAKGTLLCQCNMCLRRRDTLYPLAYECERVGVLFHVEDH